MYLTPENAHEYYGKTLDASKRILGAYPYKVGKYKGGPRKGEYAVIERTGSYMDIRRSQVFFDIVDGERIE